MTSLPGVYEHFNSTLPYKPSQLDIAYAVEDTMNQYGLDERSVKWIIDNEEARTSD